MTLLPDTTIDAVSGDEFDMMVLPGGLPGADNLNADPRIHTILKRLQQQGKYTAAICAAPKVLADAGLLHGRKATSYPGVLESMSLPQVEVCPEAVVLDDKVITSRGPGTAMDFALMLIEQLQGRESRDEVERGLCR